MAYERVAGPVGPERDDLLFGRMTASIVSALRGRKGRPLKPEDFMYDWDPEGSRLAKARREQTPEEQLRMLRGFQAAAERQTRRGQRRAPSMGTSAEGEGHVGSR